MRNCAISFTSLIIHLRWLLVNYALWNYYFRCLIYLFKNVKNDKNDKKALLPRFLYIISKSMQIHNYASPRFHRSEYYGIFSFQIMRKLYWCVCLNQLLLFHMTLIKQFFHVKCNNVRG